MSARSNSPGVASCWGRHQNFPADLGAKDRHQNFPADLGAKDLRHHHLGDSVGDLRDKHLGDSLGGLHGNLGERKLDTILAVVGPPPRELPMVAVAACSSCPWCSPTWNRQHPFEQKRLVAVATPGFVELQGLAI